MLFTTIATLLLAATAFAAPTAVESRADNCAPTSYTIPDFWLSIAAGVGANVSFNVKSTFADMNGIEDAVTTGPLCHAEGRPTLPNSNACLVPFRRLLFELRAPQDKARYQITHTWICNG